MVKAILNLSKSFFQGDKRTVLAKKNIVGSFGLRIIDAAIDYLLVPLSLAYLTETHYGIWLTISAITNWFNVLDIGISHGLRNKLSVALSNQDYKLAKEYISTAYVVIILIGLVFGLVTTTLLPLVDWSMILNVKMMTNEQLTIILKVVFLSFILGLVLKIITAIFLANEMPFYRTLINTITKVCILSFIVFLSQISVDIDHLILYSLVISVTPVLILFFSSLLFFLNQYKKYSPSISFFRPERINDIMGIGIIFFILQLGATVLFLSDNLIISHLYGPSHVTPYQITGKYYAIVLMIFTLVVTPYWSAFTKAFNENNIVWIEKSIGMLHHVWIGITILAILLLFVYKPITRIWVGEKVEIPLMLSLQWCLFIILQCLNNIYTYFLNGIGRLKGQLITGLITLAINVPLSVFFAKYLNLGTSGVILATNCSILLYVITRKIEYSNVIKERSLLC